MAIHLSGFALAKACKFTGQPLSLDGGTKLHQDINLWFFTLIRRTEPLVQKI